MTCHKNLDAGMLECKGIPQIYIYKPLLYKVASQQYASNCFPGMILSLSIFTRGKYLRDGLVQLTLSPLFNNRHHPIIPYTSFK
jgi:hypothetical protein